MSNGNNNLNIDFHDLFLISQQQYDLIQEQQSTVPLDTRTAIISDYKGNVKKIRGFQLPDYSGPLDEIANWALPYIARFVGGTAEISVGLGESFYMAFDEIMGYSDEQKRQRAIRRDANLPFFLDDDFYDVFETKYVDEATGQELNGDQLISAGEYLAAADLYVQNAFESAPSMVLSIANPVYGSAILGLSAAGGNYKDDIIHRTDLTSDQIIKNSLLAGISEWGTEYLGGKFARGVYGMKTKGVPNSTIVKEFVEPYLNTAVKRMFAGGVGEAMTESVNSVIQTSGDAWIYGDEKTIRDYASGVINSAIPAFILGGFGGGVSSFKKKDKKDLYKHISPKKWKQQYFDIGAQIADANKDLENADQFNKKDFEDRIKELVQKRDNLEENLYNSFENMSDKELKQYASNLDKINKNNSRIGNNRYTINTQETAEKENLELIQQNFDLLGTEYTAKDIEVEKLIGEALVASEIIEKRLKKLKGVNREDLDVKILENQDQINKIIKEGDVNFDEKADGIFVGKNKNGKAQIYINKQKANLRGATNVVGHELLHYMISRQFKTDNASMMPLIEDLKSYLQKNHEDVYSRLQKRIDDHYTDKDGNIKEGALEEYINVFSDLISKEKINLSDAGTSSLRNKFDSVLLGFGLQDVKIETAQDLVKFIKNYNDNINRQGLLGKLMGTKILDARIESSRLQTVDEKGQVKTMRKKSLSEDARKQISESIKEIGNTYSFKGGKDSWDKGGADNAITEIKQSGYLDDLIAAKFKGDRVPVDFVDKVYTELTNHIRNFNPEINDNLFAWINSQLANKAGNVYNKEYKQAEQERTARDVDDRTKEGEVKVQVEAEQDVAMKELEEQDISLAAEARRKREATKKTKPTYSDLRKAMGIETGGEVYNRILETARKVLIRAYDAGRTARQIQRDLTTESSTYLFKQVKNMLGTGNKYIPTIKKLREPIVNAMFTADLVQMERNLPDNEKVFTKFVKKLTNKQEVQNAVDNNLLPPSALNTIDKGQSVSLYEKIMPTEAQFIKFFDQPLINPKTGKRSGLRGTRKDQLAKHLSASLNYDATMQVAQEPSVLQKRQDLADLKGETLMDDDIEVLSSTINRNINLKFSISTDVEIKVSRDYLEILKQEGAKAQTLSTVQGLYPRNVDKKELEQSSAIIYDLVSSIYNASVYTDSGEIKNEALLEETIKRYRKQKIAAKKGKPGRKQKIDKVYKIYEQIHLDILNEVANEANIKDVKINKKVTESGLANDVMIEASQDASKIYSIEIKMDQARTVSETLNFKVVNGEIVFKSTKPTSPLAKDAMEDIQKKLKPIIQKIIKLSDSKITSSSNAISIADYANPKIKKELAKLWNEASVELSSDVVTSRMVEKGNGAINIGENGFFLLKTDNEIINERNIKIKNYIKRNHNIEVPYFEGNFKLYSQNGTSKIPKTKKFVGKHTVNARLMSRIDGDVIGRSNLNMSNKQDAKIILKAVSHSLKFSKSPGALNLNIAIKNARTPIKYSKSSRGMSAFDFDETLIDRGENFIIATSPNGEEVRISSADWPIQGPDLQSKGYTFDFKDFVNVRGGVEGPLLQKLKNRINKFGPENTYIITARPSESETAIHEWLKTQGITIPLKNITGLGNSTGEAKALWVAEKFAQGYNDIYFVDDALPNVTAVKNMMEQLDIKGKAVQAKVKFSKDMDPEFNKILEEVSGIDAKKRFSDAKAKRRGKGKGRFRFFVPPSHEDFVGLLYNFMGKGRKGEQHRDFFEKSLIKPLNKAYRELNRAKQAIANDYKSLIKQMPDVRKRLSEKILKDDYVIEDAVRVYLWDKAGFEIPGLSKTDKAKLVEIVKSDSELLEFADQIGRISRIDEGYVEPGEHWDVGNIKFDLVDATGRVGRAKFFTEFIENSDIIFSPENINKIKAIYGENFVEALKDMLYRIKTGSNRPTSKNRLVNAWLDYINGSVGATMFFNMRSALLQQLSFVNFINFADNNVFKSAAAFANQKQFWKDFSMIFNSDFLKQRRAGAAFDVNTNEIAREVSRSKNPVRATIKYLLNIGFTPTQIGDSFAIAIGGASFYRNRLKTYLKQGLDQSAAEEKAFNDFMEIAEATQQSARPDMVSQQQASPLGRLVLAFQNVTSQYVRIIKKSSLDLVNRRKSPPYTTQAQSDMANLSKIGYYGAVQSMIFYGLQSAVFAMLFDDDEKDEKFFKLKKDRIIGGTIDSILKGSGVGGAVVSTVKNYVYKLVENQKSDAYFKTPAWEELLQISPPIGIKIRKLRSAERTLEWNKDVMKEMSVFDIDNPLWDMTTIFIEGTTNAPINRLHRKLDNIRAGLDSENEWWQRVFLFGGWDQWSLGVEDTAVEEVKKDLKERQKQINKETKLKKKYPDKTKEEIKIIQTEKQVYDLNKREQIKILEANDLNPKDYPKEADRVDAIMNLREKNQYKIDSTLTAIENYVPTVEEKMSIDLFNLNKKEQIDKLLELGISPKIIKTLKYEEDRVNKIIEIQNKNKSKK